MMVPCSRILVVCSGNTCRSPLAAVILSAHLARVPELVGVTVTSAGTEALEGTPASQGSYRVALERGLDLSSHRARLATTDIVRGADLILTMGDSHMQRIASLGGEARAHLLTQFAGEVATDIADPFGQQIAVYRETAAQLDWLMARVVERLKRAQSV